MVCGDSSQGAYRPMLGSSTLRFITEMTRGVDRILVICDDPQSSCVRSTLEDDGYGVTMLASGSLPGNMFKAAEPGLIILDVSLPETDVHDLCRRIRKKSEDVAILVVSVASAVDEVVQVLSCGADGYITKPFSPLEFLARIRVAFRGSRNWAPR